MRLVFFSVLISLSACINPPEYSDIPVLEFRSFSQPTMKQGIFASDSLIMVLYFTDGDGDFGSDPKSDQKNVYTIDNRTKETFRLYKAPFIPTQGANNGISGTISLKVYSTCCYFPPASGIPPCETDPEYPTNDMTLDVYIEDRAGNKSNVITTPPIKLICN